MAMKTVTKGGQKELQTQQDKSLSATTTTTMMTTTMMTPTNSKFICVGNFKKMNVPRCLSEVLET